MPKRALTPDDVVAEARSWIGTPWNPQGHLRGIGANCVAMHLGLLARLSLPLALSESHRQVLCAMDWYLHQEREYLQEAFIGSGLLIPIAPMAMQPGDTLLFGFPRRPCSHAATLSGTTPDAMMVHTEYGRSVVERPMGPWRKRLRVVLRFDYGRLPALEGEYA